MQGINAELRTLCGCSDRHIQVLEAMGCRVHREVVSPLSRLCEQASEAGFDLRVASGFRDFERQLHIWNLKARGHRPVLGDRGQVIDFESLSARDKVFAILRWSALPGASRHHWGTDLDVYDAAAIPQDYKLQLIPEEYCGEGPFAPLSQWLSQQIARGEAQGFTRPYQEDRGGVAPEPWHLSYTPLASRFQRQLTAAGLRRVLEQTELELKAAVLEHLDEIYERFVYVH